MAQNMLNIPSYIEDPSYRYKMPRMILKIEGKGNGIKTNVVNMQDVSKALRVPTEYPLKFMGFEYGSQIIYKEKGNDITTIINGAFKDEPLQKALDKFIEKYVLCPKCKYPEFVLRVKQGLVCGKCDSCGERAKCDNAHKFASYIVKNPPKAKGINKPEEDKKVPGVPAAKEVAKAATTIPAKEEKIIQNIKKLELEDVAIGGEEIIKKIAILRESIQIQRKEDGTFTDPEIALTNTVKEMKDFNFAKGLESQLAHVLFQALFTVNIAYEINNNAEILSKTIMKLKIPRPELEIIMNLEYLLFKTFADNDFTKFVPTILKYFYDANLLTEEILVQWGQGKLDVADHILYDEQLMKKFTEAAAPLITWLSNAEDEDEEEEEEEQEQAGESKNAEEPQAEQKETSA